MNIIIIVVIIAALSIVFRIVRLRLVARRKATKSSSDDEQAKPRKSRSKKPLAPWQRSIYTVLVFAKINVLRLFRDKTAIFFTIAFPLIFLFIFGGIFGGNGESVSFNVALINQSHSQFARKFASQIKNSQSYKVQSTSLSDAKTKLKHSQIDAELILPPNFGMVKNGHNYPSGQVIVRYDQNNAQAAQSLASLLKGTFAGTNAKLTKTSGTPFSVKSEKLNQHGLTQFDYTFSGLLGFAIIGLGIFGPTNVFPELKKQGVLRRLHASPLRVWQYFVSNVLSQSVVGLISVAVMFIVAVTVFHLKMTGNYLDLAIIVILGIWEIFGIGLAIGGWAKNQNQAAPLANLVVFPLMFLTGVFFPIYLMPQWLQSIANYLPLTPVINSMRMIITQHATLVTLGPQIALIAGWAIAIYLIAFRVFRWE
ncbi:MAG: ABC transporter permease [Candidatus Saccharimonadales bacterium]